MIRHYRDLLNVLLNATPDCMMLWLAFGQFCYAYREKRGEEWMEKQDQACII